MIVQGRRASPIDLVSNLRSAVRDWREAFYIGARRLGADLGAWFAQRKWLNRLGTGSHATVKGKACPRAEFKIIQSSVREN
jgi:hypothetical protein